MALVAPRESSLSPILYPQREIILKYFLHERLVLIKMRQQEEMPLSLFLEEEAF